MLFTSITLLIIINVEDCFGTLPISKGTFIFLLSTFMTTIFVIILLRLVFFRFIFQDFLTFLTYFGKVRRDLEL